jgi:O-antigen ligase
MSGSPLNLTAAKNAADGVMSASRAWGGAPLRGTLMFLAGPAMLAAAITFFDLQLPSWLLYSFAAIFGLALVARVFRDPEWLLASCIFYLPLNKTFVVPIAAGINGTNGLLLLMVFAWIAHASREDGMPRAPLPNERLVALWGAILLVSVVTASFTLGLGYVFTTFSGDIKGWLDHFIVFFAFLNLIRNGAMARRVVVYLMLGSLLVLALGVLEWLDKRWLDSIEKARLLGPQNQPNDYGAFLVMSAAPFMGLFLSHMGKIRTWALLPYFLALAKIVLATFSRGAYVGLALAGVAAAYVRGRLFLLFMGVLGLGMLVAMPELMPESLSARMEQLTVDSGQKEELDASSQTRLILWKAAVDMTLESPVLGKGFKTFPLLKSQYTEQDVVESDNHNMYLYLSSQMGLPALLVLLLLFYRTYRLGADLYRRGDDAFARGVGLGAVAMVAGVAAVNMFGSRMVDIAVTAYFWIYLAALSRLAVELPGSTPSAEAGS